MISETSGSIVEQKQENDESGSVYGSFVDEVIQSSVDQLKDEEILNNLKMAGSSEFLDIDADNGTVLHTPIMICLF